MKKLILKSLLATTLLSSMLFISSCENDETNIQSETKPELKANGATTLTVSEGGVATIKVKLDKAINKPIQYRLVMLGSSTATDQDDYVIPGCRSNDPDCVAIEENGGPVGYIFEIPAYQTEYSVDIQTILDEGFEQEETLKLQVISNRTLLGTVNNLFYTINIQNTVSSDLTIKLNWEGTFMSNGTEQSNCDKLDMDLELLDSGFNYIQTSYSSCPETITLDSANLANGTYYLVASLWTNNNFNENVYIPAKLKFFKSGTILNNQYDISQNFLMSDGGLDDGNNNAFLTYTIQKTGTQYVVTDINNTTVFQGKQDNLNLLKSKIRNLNKK